MLKNIQSYVWKSLLTPIKSASFFKIMHCNGCQVTCRFFWKNVRWHFEKLEKKRFKLIFVELNQYYVQFPKSFQDETTRRENFPDLEAFTN